MGGQAFAKPGPRGDLPLVIPRMSPQRYQQLVEHFSSVLKVYFAKVQVPKEAPGKADHGDVDILVESFPVDPVRTADEMARLIKAKRYIANGPSWSFAVKLPSEIEDPSIPYAQLDIERCDQGFIGWEYFMQSYGDLWQILGLTIRHLGVTATNLGFFVRVPEIEPENAKTSRLFMTNDPIAVLAFMGLDTAQYEAGFQSENEMFEWIAAGRFFNGRHYDQRVNSNDRQRARKRLQFRRFVEEWVPHNQHLWATKEIPDRAQVLKEALECFNAKRPYEKLMAWWLTLKEEERMMDQISTAIRSQNPTSQKMKHALHSLKRWVRQSPNGELEVRSEATLDPDHQISFSAAAAKTSTPAVLEWISSNWEDPSAKEKSRIRRMKKEREKAR